MVNLFDYAHDNKLFKQFKVNDLLYTEYKCTESRALFPVWSHYNYFVYIISGKKLWQTLHSEYLVQTGEAVFVRKGANIIHKFFEVDFCALFLFVPDEYIADVCRDIPTQGKFQSPDSVIPIPVDETLSTYFQSVFSYFLKNQAPPKNLLEIKFRELILNLVSSPQNRSLSAYFKSLCHSHKTSIRDIMEANFPYNLRLEEFARLCGRSLSSFKRDFTDTFHTTPGKWLLHKRLAYSRLLLETTDKNINQIAFECGFENTSHYITVFKKEYGCTPHQYKSRHTLSVLQSPSLLPDPEI